MESIIANLEKTLIFSSAIWATTTGYLLLMVRLSKVDPTEGFISSKLWPDVDIRFFSNLRKIYTDIKGTKFIPTINAITQYFSFFGFSVFFVLVVAFEVTGK
jgi:hypothetical protein